jgi:hypothetical protein
VLTPSYGPVSVNLLADQQRGFAGQNGIDRKEGGVAFPIPVNMHRGNELLTVKVNG